MKLPNLLDKVKVHDVAWRAIRAIEEEDKALAARIVQRITELGIDPYPSGEQCNSKIIENLAKKKVYVKRLQCIDIKDYRIFYCVKKSGLICVYTVIYAKGRKHDEAYDEESEHYQLIKLLYKFWKGCQ